MSTPYYPIFYLKNEAISIFEIKRLDVQSDNPAHVYFWLYFDNARQQLRQLEFVSMQVEGEEQQRQFGQGQLHFNAIGGTFSPANGATPLKLQTVIPPVLSPTQEAALFAFFERA